MPYNFQPIKILTLFPAILGLIACANTPRDTGNSAAAATVRICDSSGCNDRPRNYSSVDPASMVEDEDPEGKIAALEALAKKDPRAAYDLSLRFFRGDGVRQNSYKSVQWMRDAAERGNLDAQKALGRLYLTGLGEMGADFAEAHKWLSITASRGDKEAAAMLKEVGAAKQSEQAQNLAYSRWHTTFYNFWSSNYPYRWYWRYGNWYLY
jgi:TPR repeat protein